MHFEIRGEPENYIRITLDQVYGFPDKTSFFGGYDSISIVEIKSTNYNIKGSLLVTTGNIYDFYIELEKCQQKLSGLARFDSYEHNLAFQVEYNSIGHVTVMGEYQEKHEESNLLKFSFITDQTFTRKTLDDLKGFYEQYGNNKGKVK
jgi:hypothetical protein